MSRELLDADYLFLQPLIAARVQQQVVAAVAAELGQIPVEDIEQLAAAGEGDQRPVVIYVLWAGDVPGTGDSDRAARGASQLLRQRWQLLLYVKSSGAKDARNRKAGRLLAKLHRALAGWVPEGLARPFLRVPGPRPSYTRQNALYPLEFEITLNL